MSEKTFYNFTATEQRQKLSEQAQVDDLLLLIPAAMAPEIIESLARQMSSKSKEMTLRFYSGKMNSSK
jgi:hypothetical protein